MNWMGSLALITGLAMAGLAAAADPGRDWSIRDIGIYGEDANQRFAISRNICFQVIHSEPPAADLPTAADRAALTDCDSAALYYGIGMAADPVAARKCAMIEREQADRPDLGLLSGEGILAMVYANGRGAARNMDIAIHMACQIDDAPAAMEGRITRLAELRQTVWAGDDFESCDDITSGFSGGVCADLNSQIAEQKRAARIAGLGAGWTPAQRRLFDRVYQSFAEYAETAHALDCFRGTLQAACMIAGRDTDVERFLERIEALLSGREPNRLPVDERPVNAATRSSEWKAMLAEVEPSDRRWYLQNGRETIAARAKFERELVAFAASASLTLSATQVRRFFSDL